MVVSKKTMAWGQTRLMLGELPGAQEDAVTGGMVMSTTTLRVGGRRRCGREDQWMLHDVCGDGLSMTNTRGEKMECIRTLVTYCLFGVKPSF